jgi:hypothetical protein
LKINQQIYSVHKGHEVESVVMNQLFRTRKQPYNKGVNEERMRRRPWGQRPPKILLIILAKLVSLLNN